MTEPGPATHEHLQVNDHGHPLAGAEVTTPASPHGTAQIVLHAESGHLPAGTRAHLVDAVLDLPTVQLSDHLRAYAPLGDSETISRLRECTTDLHAHAAGCTAVIDAELDTTCRRL